MADLGSLFYSLYLKDHTDEDLDKIKKKLENIRIELGYDFNENTVDAFLKKLRDTGKAISDNKAAQLSSDNVAKAAQDTRLKQMEREARILGDIQAKKSKAMQPIDSALNYARTREAISLPYESISYKNAQNRLASYIKSLSREADAQERMRKAAEKSIATREREAKAAQRQTNANNHLNTSIGQQSRLLTGLRDQLLNVYSIYSLERFATSLVEIGGEFQKQRIALQAMLGDAAKADAMYSQIKGLAIESPFNFKELMGYTKQLSAFSIPYNELYDTTKRLADISSGLGVDMGRIILAYGQVRSAAFLRGQEVRQFTEAGIPLLDELAKKFSQLENRVVSVGEVFDKISSREVPFQMVKDVLWDLTNEGGKFYNMQEVLTESLSGKLAKLKDSYEIMLSEIAQANNGLLGGTLDVITSLTGNWNGLINTINSLIAAYGAYKAVIAVVSIIRAKEIAQTISLTGAVNANTIAQYRSNMAMTQANVGAIRMLTSIQKLKVALSSLGNAGWIGIILSALAAFSTYLYNSYQEANRLKNELDDIANKSVVSAQNEIDGYSILVEKLDNVVEGSQEYNDIIDKIQSRYGAYLGNIKAEANAYAYLKGKINEVTAALRAKAMESAREQGISKITEKYSDDRVNVYKDAVEALQRNFGISKEFASQIAAIIQSDISKGMDAGLSQGYDKAVAYIKGKASELGMELNAPKSEGASESIDYFRELSVITARENMELSEFDNTLKAVMGTTTAYGIQIEKLEKAYEEEIKSVTDVVAKKNAYLKLLEAKKAVYEKFGQADEARRMDVEIANVTKLKDKWRSVGEEMFASYSYLKPKEDESAFDYADRLQKELSTQEEIENMIGTMSPKSVETAKKIRMLIQEFLKLFDIKAGKGVGSEDAVADMWKKRIDLIDKALSSYKEWSALEGKDAASNRVKENVGFKELFNKNNGFSLDLDKPEEAWKFVLGKLGKIEKQKELSLSIEMKLDKSAQGKIKEELDKSLKKIQLYVDDTTKKWDLYKQLFDITGDKKKSMSAAFGEEIGFDSLIDELKAKLRRETGSYSDMPADIVLGLDENTIREKFGKSANIILSLQKEINDKIQEGSGISLIDEQKTIMEFASVEKKIEAVKEKYQELIDSATTQEGKEAYIKKMNKEIQELNDESIKLLPLWQKLFGDTSNMGYKNLKKLVNEAKRFSETAIEKKDTSDGKSWFELTDKDGKKRNISLEEYLRLLKQIEKTQDDLNSQNPFQGVVDGFKKLKKASSKGERQDALKMIGSNAGEAARMIQGVTDAWAGMFDAFGNDELADKLGLVGEITEELGNLVEGLTSGNPIQMASSALSFIPNIIGSIAKAHDKKLDRAIQRSQLEVQKLSNAYKNIQSMIDRQLRSVTQSQSKEMINNLRAQKRELENQIADEQDKKKSDASKIEDYKQQIIELDEQLKYFYEDLANKQFGIDLKGWADQITDTLVEAFANGEDAAEAFDNTVSDIMRDVVKKMISLGVIQPAMEKLREYLFGDKGIFTDNSELGTDLSINESKGLAGMLAGLKDKIAQSQDIWDIINKSLKEQGINLENQKENEGGLSKGIQGVTEDTANLLASYLNATRQDVSVKRILQEKFFNEEFPKMSLIAQAQLQQLNAIARNTERNAQFTEEILDLFNMVVDKGGRNVRMH